MRGFESFRKFESFHILFNESTLLMAMALLRYTLQKILVNNIYNIKYSRSNYDENFE